MILNKKGFMMLPLAALLFATSCGKNVSYEEACKFVKETYADKTPQKFKSGTIEVQGKANEEFKAAVKEILEGLIETFGFEMKLDDNLHAKEELTPYEMPVLTENEILCALDGQTGSDFTYTIKGKSFTQSAHALQNDSSTGGKMEAWTTEDYNDNGLQTKFYIKAVITIDKNELGLEATANWAY